MYKTKCESCNAVSINGQACHETGCYGVLIYSKNGRQYARFKVYSLDVWGNKRDGFEVNDRSQCGSVMVPIDLNDRDIVKALKNNDLLAKRVHVKSFRIDGDEHGLNIDASKTSEPIYQLERV
jgi:hypothetical protein